MNKPTKNVSQLLFNILNSMSSLWFTIYMIQ